MLESFLSAAINSWNRGEYAPALANAFTICDSLAARYYAGKRNKRRMMLLFREIRDYLFYFNPKIKIICGGEVKLSLNSSGKGKTFEEWLYGVRCSLLHEASFGEHVDFVDEDIFGIRCGRFVLQKKIILSIILSLICCKDFDGVSLDDDPVLFYGSPPELAVRVNSFMGDPQGLLHHIGKYEKWPFLKEMFPGQ